MPTFAALASEQASKNTSLTTHWCSCIYFEPSYCAWLIGTQKYGPTHRGLQGCWRNIFGFLPEGISESPSATPNWYLHRWNSFASTSSLASPSPRASPLGWSLLCPKLLSRGSSCHPSASHFTFRFVFTVNARAKAKAKRAYSAIRQCST